ncbi:hypothetical protein BGZ63DRAFT_396640 [Mariannaea sp. PMI_226]|nr:hypothetical protein BGZ63DRAFT_396640 [Mariannaea sp. PMI_226]
MSYVRVREAADNNTTRGWSQTRQTKHPCALLLMLQSHAGGLTLLCHPSVSFSVLRMFYVCSLLCTHALCMCSAASVLLFVDMPFTCTRYGYVAYLSYFQGRARVYSPRVHLDYHSSVSQNRQKDEQSQHAHGFVRSSRQQIERRRERLDS